jgi:glutathione synthase/RimK-type ligase-like ATP-grasp enzyme
MILLISSKNLFATKRLVKEARIMKLGLRVLDLEDLIKFNFKVPVKKGDVLYVRNPYLEGKADFLPEIIQLAKVFKKAGGRVVDSNITKGDLGKGKWEDYKKLKLVGIPIPKTGLFQKLKTFSLQAINYKLPAVVKWIYGLKGRSVFLVKNVEDIKRIPSNIPKKELLVQEYIQAEYEYKVVVVGFKVLPQVLRFKTLNTGLKIDYAKYELLERSQAKQVCNLAEKAAKTLGRELCKVDILEKNGKYYVLEVNRFPGLQGFENLMEYNVFKAFIEYLQK